MSAKEEVRKSESLMDVADRRLATMGVTITELSRLMNCSRRWLYEMLAEPTPAFIADLAAFLGLDSTILSKKFLQETEEQLKRRRHLEELGKFGRTFDWKLLRSCGLVPRNVKFMECYHEAMRLFRASSMKELAGRIPRHSLHSDTRRNSSDQSLHLILATAATMVNHADSHPAINTEILEEVANNMILYPAQGLAGYLLLKDRLSAAGIHFFHLPKTPKSGVRGLSYIDSDSNHVIVVQDNDYWDTFWFAVAHEIGHMILHREQLRQDVNISYEADPVESETEEEANMFARSALLREIDLESVKLIADAPSAVTLMASDAGVDPSIVFGALAYDSGEYWFYSGYRKRLSKVIGSELSWEDTKEFIAA